MRSKELSAGDTQQSILVTIGSKTQSLAAWSRDEEAEVVYKTTY